MSAYRHKSDAIEGQEETHVEGDESSGRQKQLFIVHCESHTPAGPMKITTATRKAALEAANDFLNLKMLFVTISADGRIYTAEEFANTIEGCACDERYHEDRRMKYEWSGQSCKSWKKW